MSRIARIERATSESRIELEINLDGTGESHISTGVPFYDHMLTALSRHSLIDLTVNAVGDVDVDVHHTVEDTAICFGEALRQALGDKAGIRRFGEATVPLDEALARAIVDISGRPYLVHDGEPEGDAHFPTFDETAFIETASEPHPAGEKDDHAFTFRTLDRR